MFKLKQGLAFSALVILSVALVACGGGGDSKDPTATPGRTIKDSATILTDNKASVVYILVSGSDGDGSGSGIVWQDSSHVLTNAHVVLGGGSIKVADPADNSKTFPAKVVALSPCDDVALLQVDRSTGLKPASIGDSTQLKPGEKVISLGFPGTVASGPSALIVTEGTVSRLAATFKSSGQRDLIQNTAPINPGNSGGPLFNQYGEVVGLNSYYVPGRQAENYAISIKEATTVGEELKKGKNLDYLGMSLYVNDSDNAYYEDLPYVNGLMITGVDPGSPADKAKPYPLDYGYLIFRVNGTFVESVGAFCDVIRSHKSGDTLRIQFGAYDSAGQPHDDYTYDVIVP